MNTEKTLYVRRDVTNANEIIKHYKDQKIATFPAKELHVTIIFSRTALDWMEVPQSWQETIEYPKGGPRVMEILGGDTLALMLPPRQLKWRHDQIIEAGASHDFDSYRPHVSISDTFTGDLSDVVPWSGKVNLGHEIFEPLKADWVAGN